MKKRKPYLGQTREAYIVKLKFVNPITGLEENEEFNEVVTVSNDNLKQSHEVAQEMSLRKLRQRFSGKVPKVHYHRIDYV